MTTSGLNGCDTFTRNHAASAVATARGAREARGTTRTRGGRRAGAGRPPAYTEPLLRKTVTLPESYVARLTAYGRGNLSEGIRLLVEFACTPSGTPWLPALPPARHVPKTITGGPPPR